MSQRLAIASLLLLVSGCAGQEAKHPNPMRPIDERRAIPIIAQAFADSDQAATEGRDIKLATGKMLHVDVGTSGHKYWGRLHDHRRHLGARRQDRLTPPRGGQHRSSHRYRVRPRCGCGRARPLADDYQYDDSAGEQHESTTITAEKKLTRDVRDFLVQARSKNLP